MKKLILAACCLFTGVAFAATQKPNIILIFTDDHGYADLGCQGIFDDLKTPHIDRLAASGVRMTNGYVTAPQCVPSRGGLLSGQYQNKLGLESNNAANEPGGLDGFNRSLTIAERLKQAGYATGMAGKWHLGPGPRIVDHGFDHVYYKNSARPAMANIDLDGNDRPLGEDDTKVYHIDACSMVACSFIERYKDQPFFFYLAYRAPHVPLDATQKYLERFTGDMPERRRKALAMLSAVDDGVGDIMRTLSKHKLRNRTLVFFIGDNGAPLKIHKLDAPGDGAGWDGSLNDPMNGEKGMVSEGGVRVPYVVAWPGTIPGGQVYEHPVISLDVAATANALAGLPDDPLLDGVNLVPYLRGEKTGAPHEALYWRWTNQAAIRKGKWKYLTGDNRQYLYDMENDFEEMNNLFASQPELARQMRQELDKWTRTLNPQGLDAFGPSNATTQYFNWYLDGKRDVPTPDIDSKSGPRRASGSVIQASARRGNSPSDEEIFTRRDSDRNGIVTWDEFLNGRSEQVTAIRGSFDLRDLNKDGVWTRDEVK